MKRRVELKLHILGWIRTLHLSMTHDYLVTHKYFCFRPKPEHMTQLIYSIVI